jgi:hypothetical protein
MKNIDDLRSLAKERLPQVKKIFHSWVLLLLNSYRSQGSTSFYVSLGTMVIFHLAMRDFVVGLMQMDLDLHHR